MPSTKPRHRLFRFSMRTLLLMVTLASAGFGWLGVKVRQAQRQRDTVEAFRKLGSSIMYDYNFDSSGTFADFASPPGPVWVRNSFGVDFLANVVCVELSDGPVADADLVYLEGLNQLRHLHLRNTSVTDAGLVHLEELGQLKSLHLHNTHVTDIGLVYLQRFNQLEYLDLGNTQVTDVGLVYLQGLTQLKYLDIESTQITDAGLVHLQGLRKLEHLTYLTRKLPTSDWSIFKD